MVRSFPSVSRERSLPIDKTTRSAVAAAAAAAGTPDVSLEVTLGTPRIDVVAGICCAIATTGFHVA